MKNNYNFSDHSVAANIFVMFALVPLVLLTFLLALVWVPVVLTTAIVILFIAWVDDKVRKVA